MPSNYESQNARRAELAKQAAEKKAADDKATKDRANTAQKAILRTEVSKIKGKEAHADASKVQDDVRSRTDAAKSRGTKSVDKADKKGKK